jgi:hypothetical protein
VCVPTCFIYFFNKHDLKYIYVCLEFTKIIESVWQIKWKTKNTTLSQDFQNTIETIVERGTIDTFNTHIHEHSLSLGICISIKSGGVKLVLKD